MLFVQTLIGYLAFMFFIGMGVYGIAAVYFVIRDAPEPETGESFRVRQRKVYAALPRWVKLTGFISIGGYLACLLAILTLYFGV